MILISLKSGLFGIIFSHENSFEYAQNHIFKVKIWPKFARNRNIVIFKDSHIQHLWRLCASAGSQKHKSGTLISRLKTHKNSLKYNGTLAKVDVRSFGIWQICLKNIPKIIKHRGSQIQINGEIWRNLTNTKSLK